MKPAPEGWETVVRLRATSAGVPSRELLPDRDLVFDMPRGQGASLPFGVLLDDRLPPEARAALDAEAAERLFEWRQRRDGELTVHGVCLPEIWHVELLAEVFVPEVRIASGVRAAIGAGGPDRLEVMGLDEQRVDVLSGVLSPLGVETIAVGSPAEPPRYPSVLASPWRIPWPLRLAAAVRDAVGVPQRLRGGVCVFPYWHLAPVFERLLTLAGLEPVLDPGHPLRARPRDLLTSAARGGWVGHPGAAARRRSRRALAEATSRVSNADGDSLTRLLDERALTMLNMRAGDTLAVVSRLRSACSSRRVKAVVLPFDSPPDARMIVHAARESGVPILVIQHGLANEPNEPDKTLADAVAVWSETDLRELRKRTSALIEVTGNPGLATAPAGNQQLRPTADQRHALVLVEYASRLSTRTDSRVSMRHVTTALRALAAARPGSAVIVRPHPAEHEPQIFETLATDYESLYVSVDTSSPIAALIGAADLCVGAVSTATLEAAVADVPVILLNVTGHVARWPFDGSTAVPVARTAEELADLIRCVLASGSVPGKAEMTQALGVRPDAVERVVDLIRTLAAR